MTSQPAAQPSEPVSTFDLEIFWTLHKQKILIGAALLVAALLGSSLYFGFQAMQSQKAGQPTPQPIRWMPGGP